ncbi:MAG TPA: GNAT family N-acetyltransferase [Gemmatimonadaceae bacterium]|nr:GNAT family N-acetyltransferase [Gemmatimonadaceae bacterium]
MGAPIGTAYVLRPARAADVPAILSLVNGFAAEQRMLPRTSESVLLTLDDFVVAAGARGEVLACGALKEYSPSLAEVASVAVAPAAHGRGLGAAVVRAVEALARVRGVGELFALTLTPGFFETLGYEIADRVRYPEKLRRDCAGCPRRVGCAEVCVRRAMAARGQMAGGGAERAA